MGIDRYASPGVNWLSCARRDAAALHGLFTDSMGEEAVLLADEQASWAAIEEEASDDVVVAFSGHGSEFSVGGSQPDRGAGVSSMVRSVGHDTPASRSRPRLPKWPSTSIAFFQTPESKVGAHSTTSTSWPTSQAVSTLSRLRSRRAVCAPILFRSVTALHRLWQTNFCLKGPTESCIQVFAIAQEAALRVSGQHLFSIPAALSSIGSRLRRKRAPSSTRRSQPVIDREPRASITPLSAKESL